MIFIPNFSDAIDNIKNNEKIYNEHNFLFVADKNDILITRKPVNIYFEKYISKKVGYSLPTIITLRHNYNSKSFYESIINDKKTILEIINLVKNNSDNQTIHPYLYNNSIKQIGDILISCSGKNINYESPPSLLKQKLKQKIYFKTLVKNILGDNKTPPFYIAENIEAFIKIIKQLESKKSMAMLKLPFKIGSQNNYKINIKNSKKIINVIKKINDLIDNGTNYFKEPLLIEKFIESAKCFPTVQLFIKGEGRIKLIRICNQIIDFNWRCIGSNYPVNLKYELKEKIIEDSLKLARYISTTGYKGNCNFDLIVKNNSYYFLECNPRWGSTSYPSLLMQKLFPDNKNYYYAEELYSPELKNLSVALLLKKSDTYLYDKLNNDEGIIIYNISKLQLFGKMSYISFSKNKNNVNKYCSKFKKSISTYLKDYQINNNKIKIDLF